MSLLLDTCIVYDWLMGQVTDERLIERVQAEGAHVSAVAVWEVAIKAGLGKLPLPTHDVVGSIEAQGFAWLPVLPRHAQAVLGLEAHHRDPFDRLLIAQAGVAGMQVVTYDTIFSAYLPDTWVVR